MGWAERGGGGRAGNGAAEGVTRRQGGGGAGARPHRPPLRPGPPPRAPHPGREGRGGCSPVAASRGGVEEGGGGQAAGFRRAPDAFNSGGFCPRRRLIFSDVFHLRMDLQRLQQRAAVPR